MRLWLILVGSVAVAIGFCLPARAADKPTGYECSLTAVTCGQMVGTTWEAGLCGVIELKKIGKLSDKEYTQVTIFVGYRVSGEVLFIGGAGAKSGLAVTCKVPWNDKAKSPNYDAIKKELPTLILADPAVKAKFPNLKKAELDKAFKIEPVKPDRAREVLSHPDYKVHKK